MEEYSVSYTVSWLGRFFIHVISEEEDSPAAPSEKKKDEEISVPQPHSIAMMKGGKVLTFDSIEKLAAHLLKNASFYLGERTTS
jgi:hypothetical protein